jgi:hypothetical protein
MTHASAPVFLLLLSPLAAQTIADGNMTFTQGPMSTLQTEAAIVDADLQTAGPQSTDHAVEYWWFYRLGGETREYPLRLDGTAYQPPPPTPSSQATFWPDVDGKGFQMQLHSEIYSAGPANGYVVHRMGIWNFGAAPMAIDVFLFCDLDVCGTSSNSASTTRDVHTVTDTCGRVFQVHGQNADHSEAGIPGPMRTALCDSSITVLADNFGPQPVGDYAGAFNWTLNLQPGQAVTCVSWVTADFELGTLPLYALYGTEGTGANWIAPRMVRNGAAVQLNSARQHFAYDLSLAAPGVPALFLQALGRGSTTVLGVDIHVDLATTVPILLFTSPAGTGSVTIGLPRGTALTGQQHNAQFLVADSGAWNGLASWTFAQEAIIGHQ